MRIQDLDEAVGRIVKGVNTTADVGPAEIKTQAAKFGNKVDKDGRPPTHNKKVKGSKTNVLYNLGLSEMERACIEGGHSLDDLKPLKENKKKSDLFDVLSNYANILETENLKTKKKYFSNANRVKPKLNDGDVYISDHMRDRASERDVDARELVRMINQILVNDQEARQKLEGLPSGGGAVIKNKILLKDPSRKGLPWFAIRKIEMPEEYPYENSYLLKTVRPDFLKQHVSQNTIYV